MPVHHPTNQRPCNFINGPGGIVFLMPMFCFPDAYESFIKYLGFSWYEWFENPVWAVPIRRSS